MLTEWVPIWLSAKKAVLIILVWSYASVISLYWSQLKVSNHCCQKSSHKSSLIMSSPPIWNSRLSQVQVILLESTTLHNESQRSGKLMSSITLWLWRYGLDGRSAAQRSRWVGSHPSPPALSPESHHKPRNNRNGWRALWSRSESQSCRASTASPA